ncbi:potassium channel family protein [Roseivirga sp.]|uniref:potassium channel family protein n=1 Tax=Roseivirga sp. TaxID=1964215 RepID=UPI002B27400F|nr:potassium channel family protein [Roseivirga sp.]
MKKLLTLITLAVLLLLTSFSALAQEEIKYTEYSYTEFFQMIEDEEDSVFELKNAFINFADQKDLKYLKPITKTNGVRTDTLFIKKQINLTNVRFLNNSQERFVQTFYLMSFEEEVTLTNVFTFAISNSTFKKSFNSRTDDVKPQNLTANLYPRPYLLTNINFRGGISLTLDFDGLLTNPALNNYPGLIIDNSKISSLNNSSYSRIAVLGAKLAVLNSDISDKVILWIIAENGLEIYGNLFNTPRVRIEVNTDIENKSKLTNNSFAGHVILKANKLENIILDWSDISNKLIDVESYLSKISILNEFDTLSKGSSLDKFYSEAKIRYYKDSLRIKHKDTYNEEIDLRGRFYKLFKEKHDTESANEVYIELKDIETARLAHLYSEKKTFDGFFKWKINQFLKLFSAYGTEPAKAITFSVYVILAFALIYLFFPNHWDSHGKNRIMDRYRFFLKYVNRDSGIHEVYLEEQKQDLLNAEDFKTYLLEQGKTAPKFFMATAMPLYKWSVAGTRTFSWFLEKIDFLKGKWSETEPSKQGGKSVLLITAFLIALTYDIFIKMLNALMLSINTFTTLGFGEIPIKGLPRYLAIIQGFIGWFMLTIFSVSLISQLLN